MACRMYFNHVFQPAKKKDFFRISVLNSLMSMYIGMSGICLLDMSDWSALGRMCLCTSGL